jgi:hypothetical protein
MFQWMKDLFDKIGVRAVFHRLADDLTDKFSAFEKRVIAVEQKLLALEAKGKKAEKTEDTDSDKVVKSAKAK